MPIDPTDEEIICFTDDHVDEETDKRVADILQRGRTYFETENVPSSAYPELSKRDEVILELRLYNRTKK